MDPLPLDLDKLALALGRAQIEIMALQQQLDVALAAGNARTGTAAGGDVGSYPLEMDHDRVPAGATPRSI